ncbi:MAG: ZIP family metal transporter [Gammaproteobacteria bacterium]
MLLESGYTRSRALLLNMLSSVTTVLGAMLAYFGLGVDSPALPYVIAVAVAGFIYIAVADLIPGLHRRSDPASGITQVLLIAVGIGAIALAENLLQHR